MACFTPIEKRWEMKQGVELISLNDVSEKIKSFL